MLSIIIKKEFHRFNYHVIALQNELAALPHFNLVLSVSLDSGQFDIESKIH